MPVQSDVYELRMGWSISHVEAQTTFHIAVDETLAGNPLFRAKAVELAWFNRFALEWFFNLPRDVIYRRVACGRINNGGGPWYRNTRLTPGNPSNPESVYAAVVTGINFQSLNAGRWITTRLRFPGLSEGAVVDNRISSTISGRIGSIADLLLQSFNFAGVVYEPVAWSRDSGLWSHFASARVENFVHGLKSRRPGWTRRRVW